MASDNSGDEEPAAAPETESTGHSSTEPSAAATASTGGSGRDIAQGAGAVIGAALGITSLTGTSLADMLRARAEIEGQIQSSIGGGGDPVESIYTTPWHHVALVNGVFAIAAIVVTLVVLLLGRVGHSTWSRAVAVAGVILGLIGLLLAGGMYADLFGAPPQVPTTPGM